MSQGLDDFNARYVYRVLRPDEDPYEDIACKAPHSRRTVSEHIETGLREPSKFISTTSSYETASKWLQTSDSITTMKYRNRRTTIVRIDLNIIKQYYPNIADSAVDLTCPYNRNIFLHNEKQKSFAAAYKEVLFPHSIPSEAVSVEYIKGQGFVRNETSTRNISLPPAIKHKNTTHYLPPDRQAPNTTSSVLNNQFDTSYNTGNRTPAATYLRESQSSDYNWNSQFSDYKGISSRVQNQTIKPNYPPRSVYSDNTTSLRQTKNIYSDASSNQWTNKSPSTYSTRDNMTSRPPSSSTTNFAPSYLSSRHSLRDEPPPTRANTSIWQRILAFFSLV